MNGAMIHVPVGEQGILVLIGGQTTMVPTPYGIGIQNANAGNTNINNSFVDIFDIERGIGSGRMHSVYRIFQREDQIFVPFL
jgi:hypothetical protein